MVAPRFLRESEPYELPRWYFYVKINAFVIHNYYIFVIVGRASTKLMYTVMYML